MPTIDIQVQRFSVVSRQPFDEVIRRLTATIGRPDLQRFHDAVASAATMGELETVVRQAVGSSDLMEFVRFDSGDVLRKEGGGQGPRMLRLVVGNPLIMNEMARAIPDAAAYAPVTILIDERPDGVHVSYDSMVSLLAPYGHEDVLNTARDLDLKVEGLIRAAAA